MGDADVAQNNLPISELETLLEDALMEADEEMGRIISFVNLLKARTDCVTSQVAAWENFRRCFTALNLFAIPAVLAIGIAYGTAGTFASGSTLENILDSFLMILMYVSMSVGLPLYVFTLWEAYFAEPEGEDVLAGNGRDLASDSESELALAATEESIDTVGQFRALSRARLWHTRSDLETRNSDEEQPPDNLQRRTDSEGFGIALHSVPSTFNSKEIQSVNQQFSETDFEASLTESYSNASVSETLQREENDFCGLELILVDDSSMEKNDDVIIEGIIVSGGQWTEIQKTPSRGIRNIAIKKGDGGVPFTQEGFLTEQGFGL